LKSDGPEQEPVLQQAMSLDNISDLKKDETGERLLEEGDNIDEK